MNDKQKPLFCQTASAFLIKDGKILLIKHKKLGVWMMPGGHLEGSELPHEAAEREFFEETGISVVAVGENEGLGELPSPFKAGLHWACEENFVRRQKKQPVLPQWSRGCEQHFDLGYLVAPTSNVKFSQNTVETDGIDWFSLEEVINLDTFENIKKSVIKAFAYEKINH